MVIHLISRILARRKMTRPLRVVGLVCVGVSLLTLAFLFTPIIIKRLSYDMAGHYPILAGVFHRQPVAQDEPPVSTEFGLVIPKLNVNVPVVADVQSDIPHAYFRQLRSGVAHYKGTAKPGETGNTVIYGHSSTIPGIDKTPYDTVFVLLDKLTSGDAIILYWHDRSYHYKVKSVSTKSDQALEVLDQNITTPRLTLLTCWPPGTDIKRLVVIAELGQ